MALLPLASPRAPYVGCCTRGPGHVSDGSVVARSMRAQEQVSTVLKLLGRRMKSSFN
ncbi:hypothetical protein KSP39_PZI001696 [Platanthera zijinensis]|uniref:Uncharacterized protein n=1 Tax=Platanthera zijinensis TaxID=2320716 RepID=A0AAP0C006_9ASPA